MLSMRQIEVFRAVMTTGTVTEASRMLGVSQPAVSRLLRYTEDQIGVALFARQGGRLIPTDEAWTLYPQTERLFGELDDVRRVAEELPYFRAGRLRISAIPLLGFSLVPITVTRFRRAYPDVNISVETRRNYEIASQVAENKVDVGLSLGPPEFPNIVSEVLFATELVCVMPDDHPLAALERVSWSDLDGVPVITLKGGLPIGAAVHEGLQGVENASVVVEVTESVVACALVGEGAGLAVIDALTASRHGAPNVIHRPIAPCPPIPVRILTSPTRRPSLLVDTFINQLRADTQGEGYGA